jgi:hypothetical protein
MSRLAIKPHLFASLAVIDSVANLQRVIETMPECRDKIVLEVECRHMMDTARKFLDNSSDLYDKLLDFAVAT